MSVKLGRYIFKRIRGRIIPIRVGAKAVSKAGKSGVSKSIMRKLKTILGSNDIKMTKKMSLKVKTDFSGSDYMDSFMKKTGSVRVSSRSDFLSIDPETQLTNIQKSVIGKMARGKEVITESSSGFNFFEQLSKATKGKPSIKNTKIGEKLRQKAINRFGTTNNDEITGYVLPRGEKLNFSYGYGQRDIDHRQVSEIMNLPATRKPKKGELLEILGKAQRERKSAQGKKHLHNELIERIKYYQKSKVFDSDDRAMLIKGAITQLEFRHKTHLLKKLKKKKFITPKLKPTRAMKANKLLDKMQARERKLLSNIRSTDDIQEKKSLFSKLSKSQKLGKNIFKITIGK